MNQTHVGGGGGGQHEVKDIINEYKKIGGRIKNNYHKIVGVR